MLDEPNRVIGGYLNVDPYAKPNDGTGRVVGDIANLSSMVDQAECDEIVAYGILDRLIPSDGQKCLENWFALLAPRGVLVLSVLDVYGAFHRLMEGSLKPSDYSNLIHGNAYQLSHLRKVSYSPDDLTQIILPSRGYKIISAKYDRVRTMFVVEAGRND